jgi:hypothetical protein
VWTTIHLPIASHIVGITDALFVDIGLFVAMGCYYFLGLTWNLDPFNNLHPKEL